MAVRLTVKRALLAGVVIASVLAAPARAAATDPIAHDPTLIKQGAWYYDVITGDAGTRTYLPVRRSKDLIHWQLLGPVFTTPPAWVPAALGITPVDFWAPDITRAGGEYRLYYAASQFATNNSVIGLATTKSLDPASPDYGWVDRGMVLRSTPGVDDFNAIDPDVVVDANGASWLALGSFWSGIKLRRLDPATGMPSAADPVFHALATRQAPGAVEGPSIVRHGRFYYLFASFDFCCRGVDSDYRLMVGRARSVLGPYVDRAGAPMLQGGGTELLRGYNEFAGPGGADVYGHLLVHHYYDRDDAGLPKLSVRRLRWRAGWPVLGDPLSGSREPGYGNAYLTITERRSGAPVEDAGCGYEGADIRLGRDPRSPCAQWRPELRGDGYSLGNRFSNKVAEAAACGTTNGTNVAQWGWLNNDCQRFGFEPAGGGFVRIVNERSGRVFDVAGTDVQLWDADPARRQQFALQPAGPVLLPVLGVDRTWRFHRAALGYSTITPARSDRELAADGRLVRRGHGARWALLPAADGTFRLIARGGGELVTKVVLPRLARQR
jgi:arabinan endo-1,5-alpha-L-arabinosidase